MVDPDPKGIENLTAFLFNKGMPKDFDPDDLPDDQMEVKVPLPKPITKTKEGGGGEVLDAGVEEKKVNIVDEYFPKRTYTKRKLGPRRKPAYLRANSTDSEEDDCNDIIGSDAE